MRHHHFGIRCPPLEDKPCDSSFKTRLKKRVFHLYLTDNHTCSNAGHSQINTHAAHSCQSTAQQSLILDLISEGESYRTDGYANKSEVLPVKALNKWTECMLST